VTEHLCQWFVDITSLGDDEWRSVLVREWREGPAKDCPACHPQPVAKAKRTHES
jgi:hypothetical protein